MWQRRTFHECASELDAISGDFRAAHTNQWGWDEPRRNMVLRDTSIRGVEVLRILALSIRSDQDYDLTEKTQAPVGAFLKNAGNISLPTFIENYRPPYSSLSGFSPIGLRQALNKIAHANPAGSGYFADKSAHDLILTGTDQGNTWITVFSLVDLCKVIKSLPDTATKQ